MDAARRIVALDEIAVDDTLLFTIRDGFDREEAILTRLADGVAAYRNHCQHWTDVRLDSGDGAAIRDGELLCQRHGALFEQATGYCTTGPCEGATLDSVDVTVENGAVYLTEPDYEFEKLGPSGEHDLSSRGRIDFSGT
ncbi:MULTISPECIES: Rieske (2Fe-2S) protein [Halococcus]|uniref:Oxidoreductase n=1 Tax=Halococcus salifodinae DSM 8989 TaxID=1227456 RepID=M0N840_9EURY|nr:MULTISPECIES: Rieske 2Fe-2S domain-containing protein [Halococcus]EMA53743.1 oxidoreductase [Halococcus salifodinae DSM 8989]